MKKIILAFLLNGVFIYSSSAIAAIPKEDKIKFVNKLFQYSQTHNRLVNNPNEYLFVELKQRGNLGVIYGTINQHDGYSYRCNSGYLIVNELQAYDIDNNKLKCYRGEDAKVKLYDYLSMKAPKSGVYRLGFGKEFTVINYASRTIGISGTDIGSAARDSISRHFLGEKIL